MLLSNTCLVLTPGYTPTNPFFSFQLFMILLSLFMKECRSYPVDCSKEKALRKRYMFVKNTSTDVPVSGTRYAASKQCPYEWVENVDNNRYPRRIAKAICDKKKCDEWYCLPVRYRMLVFKKTPGKKNEWKPAPETVNVAFVYSKK